MSTSLYYSWIKKNALFLDAYDSSVYSEFPSNEFIDHFYFWLFQVKSKNIMDCKAPWRTDFYSMTGGVNSFTSWGQKNMEEIIKEIQKYWTTEFEDRYDFFDDYYSSDTFLPFEIDDYRQFFKNDWYFENAKKKWNKYKYCHFMYALYFDRDKSIARICEDRVRVKHNLPLVGEGWISETALFYLVKETFDEYEVINHGSPEFLGRQHYDVYFPKLKIALEYQGVQHSKPVDYFGGEKAFKKNQERDKRKKIISKEAGVVLIEVFPKYDEKKLIAKIKRAIKKQL